MRIVPALALMFGTLCVLAATCCFANPVDNDAANGASNEAPPAAGNGVRRVDFADDVQPILRRHCFRCHGTKNQEADLQLNRRADALGDPNAGDRVIVPHKPNSSLIIQRLVDQDQGDIMPLDGNPLSESEITTLRQWIEQGAAWPDEHADAEHWAYQKIRSLTPPIIQSPIIQSPKDRSTPSDSIDAPVVVTPIDQFIRQRLLRAGIGPSPPLDRPRLIRRVSLALTGIPPTVDQVQSFVDDPSPDAYEKVVDRLLRSQHYGQRWAVPWLDLARYADSNGFQADQIRDNWAYRDWVIRSFNQDLPFNDFVIDQIAGDLRPDATVDQKIATGFHRMTTCNVEAGVHPEANRTNQIVDRVNTTATVFMGTTMECAQCHDHKYDPFTQQDYYRLFAYFNNTPLEVQNTSGVTWDFVGPKMDLPIDDRLRQQRDKLTQQVAALEARRDNLAAATDDEFTDWLASLRRSLENKPRWRSVSPAQFQSTADEAFEILDDGAVLLTGSVPDTVEHVFTFDLNSFESESFVDDASLTAIRIDLLTDDRVPGKGPGRGDAKRSNVILSELNCVLVNDQQTQTIQLDDAKADFSQSKWEVSQAIDGNRKTGWAIAPQFGKPHWASFALTEPLSLKKLASTKLAGKESGAKMVVTLGQFYGRGRTAAKPRVSFFDGDPAVLTLPEKLQTLAAKKRLSDKQRALLRAEFDQHSPKLRSLQRQIEKAQAELRSLSPDTTLVMVEMESPRETFVMIRGDYENLGDRVSPGTPAIFASNETKPARPDRMELAKWLTSPNNPLLPRVTVNRWWAELFGTGLVSTCEDFGTQGESPSHPDLLDYLANELVTSGWSMKQIHKQMVMSATFQQSSHLTPRLAKIDPDNRLLARGPRVRLSAETIRDNALAISGLLSNKMFGPPIMPFQPDNIWRSVGRNQPKWIAADNEDRFRRGVYVICKRAAPYPSFINFDAPDRGSCSVRRSRTNTPLQALTLLNDPAYAEMSLAMADRVLYDTPNQNDRQRLTYAMRLAIAREPNDREISILQRLLQQERQRVDDDAILVQQRTSVPVDSMKLRSDNRSELAAWFAVTNAILNLDETINR